MFKFLKTFLQKELKLLGWDLSTEKPFDVEHVPLSQNDLHSSLFKTFWKECNHGYTRLYTDIGYLVTDLLGWEFDLEKARRLLNKKPITGRFKLRVEGDEEVRFISLFVNNRLILLLDSPCFDFGLNPVMVYSEEYQGFVVESSNFIDYMAKYNFNFEHLQEQ